MWNSLTLRRIQLKMILLLLLVIKIVIQLTTNSAEQLHSVMITIIRNRTQREIGWEIFQKWEINLLRIKAKRSKKSWRCRIQNLLTMVRKGLAMLEWRTKKGKYYFLETTHSIGQDILVAMFWQQIPPPWSNGLWSLH